jgi:hypothetical protein
VICELYLFVICELYLWHVKNFKNVKFIIYDGLVLFYEIKIQKVPTLNGIPGSAPIYMEKKMSQFLYFLM